MRILKSFLLVGVCLAEIALGITVSDRERRSLSAEEHQAAIIRENIGNVEIIYPTEIGNRRTLHDSASRTSRRHRRSTEHHDEEIFYKVSAFGEKHRLNLRVNNDLFAPGFHVERFREDGQVDHSTLVDQCFLTGETLGTHYAVAVSDCDGLAGVIVLDNETLIIEPLLNVSRDSNSSGVRPHLVYKSKTKELLKDTEDLAAPSPLKIKIQRKFTANVPKTKTSASPSLAKTTPTLMSVTTTQAENATTEPTPPPYDSHVEFVNTLWRTIKLIYVDFYNREVFFQNILPRSKQRVNTFLTDKWLARDDETKQLLLINKKNVFVPVANTGENNRTIANITAPWWMKSSKPPVVRPDVKLGNRFIEVLAVADESMVKWHGKKSVERYVLSMINIASMVYKHKSLPVGLQFVAVRLIILEKNPPNIRILNSPSASLNSVCRWTSGLRRGKTDSDPDFHDLAVFITKKDFGPAGYAPVWGMCRDSRSCTLNRDDGFTSSFIIAHEVGHTLGLGHDGIDNNCKEEALRGSVMAPTVYSRYDRFFWSSCSQQEILASMKHFWCLNDAPAKQKLPFLGTLPGVHYTLDEQCQFDFDKNFSFCRAFYRDPCKELWCNMPGKYTQFCRTMRGPALDGSKCGDGKWCFQGYCIVANTTMIPVPTTDPPPVDGGWSVWGSYGPCSRTCGSSLKTRKRECTNPSPSNDGKPCEGHNAEYHVCKLKDCPPPEKRFTELRRWVCEQYSPTISNRDLLWTLYNPKKVNIGCDFQRGFCKWNNVKGGDEFDWELISGPSPSDQTGALADHTLGTIEGKYLYTEGSRPQETFHRARLESPPLAVRVSCLTFWYIMNGLDLGDINVYINSTTGEKKLWTVSGHQGSSWLQKKLTINGTGAGLEGYKIVIEAIRGYGYRSDIGLDDISFTLGACESQKTEELEPETSACYMSCRTTSSADDKVLMDIQVVDGLPCYPNSIADVCIGGTCKKLGCDNIIGSTKLMDICAVCGGDNSTCSARKGTVNIIPRRDYETLKSFPKGSTNVKVEESTPSPHHLALQTDVDGATRGINVQNEILPPGIYTVRGTRFRYSLHGDREMIESLDPLKQNFKVSVIPDKTKVEPVVINYIFYRPKNTKKTPKKHKWVLSGWSECDKKCGGGTQYSLYKCKSVKKKNEQVPKHYCGKRTPHKVRKCNSKPCLKKFEWFIGNWSECSSSCNGGIMHRNVTCVRTSDGWTVSTSLCGVEGPSHIKLCGKAVCKPKWHVGEWSKCSSKCGPSQSFRLVECKNWLGVLSQACDEKTRPSSTKSCPVKPCPTEPPSAVAVASIAGDDNLETNTCTFQHGLCQWINSPDGNFNWTIHQGKTPSKKTGPSRDHTSKRKDGKYIYIEASKPNKAGFKARLESPLITTNKNCLEFWFHMYGSQVGGLNIILKLAVGEHTLWKRSLSSGDRWINGKLTITTLLQYKVIFEGVVGDGFSGDIALDDLSITPGRCKNSKSTRRN